MKQNFKVWWLYQFGLLSRLIFRLTWHFVRELFCRNIYFRTSSGNKYLIRSVRIMPVDTESDNSILNRIIYFRRSSLVNRKQSVVCIRFSICKSTTFYTFVQKEVLCFLVSFEFSRSSLTLLRNSSTFIVSSSKLLSPNQASIPPVPR